MSLAITAESEKQYYPVFLDILSDIKGGVTIATTNIPTSTLELFAGTPLHKNASTAGLYNPVKTATLKRTLGTAACVCIYVYSANIPGEPGQNFKVGEYIMVDNRGTAVTIAAITIGTKTNGVGTDIILLTAGSGGLHCTAITGTKLQQAAAGGLASLAAPLYTANCLLLDSIRVRKDDGTTLTNITAGAVTRGEVNESRMPFSAPTEAVKTPLTDRIRFV